jgi:chromosome segregation ATPase
VAWDTLPPMGSDERGLMDRLSRQSEEALGRIAEELVRNPLVAGALSRALSAREKAVQAQETAMGALGIPSTADVERLTRRLRSVSQRLEGIEDSLDRVEARLEVLASAASEAEDGSTADLDGRLDEVSRDLAALREAVAPENQLPPQSLERLRVGRPTGEGTTGGRVGGGGASRAQRSS